MPLRKGGGLVAARGTCLGRAKRRITPSCPSFPCCASYLPNCASSLLLDATSPAAIALAPAMSFVGLRRAAVALASSALIVLTAAPGTYGACNDTCRRDIARCVATQCEGVGREACRRRCKPAAIRTLAYAQSECREDPSNHTYVAHQELRIRRGEREPITVATFDSSRVADPLGFCPQWGHSKYRDIRGFG